MKNGAIPGTLDLVRGDKILGTVVVDAAACDFPWYAGSFKPTEDFEAVRELFEGELALLRANTDDKSWDEWEAMYDELSDPGLRLQSRDGGYVADGLIIHVSGAEAWWRQPPE
jgi:hypothetical protein